MRRLVLPQRIEKWSLTSLQQRLVKTGAWLVKYARYYWRLLVERAYKKQVVSIFYRLTLLSQGIFRIEVVKIMSEKSGSPHLEERIITKWLAKVETPT